ncbi:MAG TPA: ABC transporter permease, partial [Polyangia bacterium]|nr:ABC transporter permease [Polyangia bacterium]
MNAATRDRVISVMSPVLLVVTWELMVRTRVLDPRFFPAPTAIALQAGKLVRSGELGAHTAASLSRLGLGVLLGGVPALLLGIAMGLYRPVRAALEPLVAATYPIPKSAILPLILLVFGLGEASKIVMV